MDAFSTLFLQFEEGAHYMLGYKSLFPVQQYSCRKNLWIRSKYIKNVLFPVNNFYFDAKPRTKNEQGINILVEVIVIYPKRQNYYYYYYNFKDIPLTNLPHKAPMA